jgi:hypothetical protein
MIFAHRNHIAKCVGTIESWFEDIKSLPGENRCPMLTENRFKNCPILSSTSNDPPVHHAQNASQLIIRRSVHLQVINWHTDFISISPFLKTIEFNDQPESNRFGSIAF